MSREGTGKQNPILGRWRIVSTDAWEGQDLDLLGPALLSFAEEGLGSLRLVAIQADVDFRVRNRPGGWRADFSWSGMDDGSPVSGRGWARVVGPDELDGMLFIHLGDEARFRALRERRP